MTTQGSLWSKKVAFLSSRPEPCSSLPQLSFLAGRWDNWPHCKGGHGPSSTHSLLHVNPHLCKEHLRPRSHSSGRVTSCSPSPVHLQERASGAQETQREPNTLSDNRMDVARPGHLCASPPAPSTGNTRSCSKLCRQLTGLPVSLWILGG